MSGGTEPLLRVSELRKTFGGLHALEDINLEVWPGEVVGLVGDNGAGKSTLVRCISGYYTPDAGEIAVDGESLGLRRPQARRRTWHRDRPPGPVAGHAWRCRAEPLPQP